MTAPVVPFSSLVKFGDMTFTGSGIPANVSTDVSPVDDEPTVDRPTMPNPAVDYQLPRLGYTPGSIKEVSAWTVTVQANDGLTTTQKTQALESAYATWYALWRGTHTHNGEAGTTGQLGYVVALDAKGEAWQAEADLLKFPLALVSGENIDIFTILLEFTLTSDWSVGGGPAVYGEGIYGESTYS